MKDHGKLDLLLLKVEMALCRLENLERMVCKIMATEKQLLAEMAKVNDATNKIADAEQKDGDALQKISDDLDKIVANGPGGITDATFSTFQNMANNLQALSDAADARAQFAKAVGQKADDAVPIPPPPPAPVTP